MSETTVECMYCERPITTNTLEEFEAHVYQTCPQRPLKVSDLDEIRKQISEIHSFINSLGQAFNSPMIQAMIPANLRNVIGG